MKDNKSHQVCFVLHHRRRASKIFKLSVKPFRRWIDVPYHEGVFLDGIATVLSFFFYIIHKFIHKFLFLQASYSYILCPFQTTAQLHGTIGASRSTNFSFKKDFVKDSMVVLGPERTFKLRNPLVLSSSSGLQQQSSGLLHGMDDGTASIRGASISPFNTTHKIRTVCVCFSFALFFVSFLV